MKYNRLGDMHVSEICLGTMTFGEQNSLAEAIDSIHFRYPNPAP